MKFSTKIRISIIYASILSVVAIILGTLEMFAFLGLNSGVPEDIMGGFSLIVGGSLILYGARDTMKLLYKGLSFYIVGIALLLGLGFLKIILLLADWLDYYVQCIGESCPRYSAEIRPEIYLFFLFLFALYPFFRRWRFRRLNND
jgi:xanthine/uracil permease